MNNDRIQKKIMSMRKGGKILAQIFNELRDYVKPGLTELEIDNWVFEKIKQMGAIATYKTKEVNFPAAICISVNDQIVHSVPSQKIIEYGDVVSFDLVIDYEGMKVDSAFTMIVGNEKNNQKLKLIRETENSLMQGIRAITGENTKVGEISNAIQTVLEKANLGIVKELVGHGIGEKMHMPPDIPNWGKKDSGKVLLAGDTIAIEPMATLGSSEIIFNHQDGWTISTKDKSLAAHFEHTVLVTNDGYEILTSL